MKVLHVVQAYHPAIGGSERLAQGLAEHLVSRHGDAVTVYTSNALRPEAFWKTAGPLLPPGTETINGVAVRRFRVYNGLRLLRRLLAQGSHRLRLPYNDWLRTLQTGPIIPGLRAAIAHSGADVVFATAFPFLHMVDAVAGAHRADIPAVLLGAIHVPDLWSYDRPMIYRAIGRADAYVAHTPFERDHVIQRGIDEHKVSVIGAGVDASTMARGDRRRLRKRYGWGAAPVVGLIARQSPLKRIDTLLQAMPYVWAACPSAQLLFAGARTSYSPHIDAMIAALPPEQRTKVTAIGDFAEADKPDIYAACDLIAHPSGNESFGIVFVEAWAAGKPVVGARVGAIPSVIDEGRDGILFEYLNAQDLARAIVLLLREPALREAMAQAGRDKVRRQYTWEAVTDRLRAVYCEVIARRRHKRSER
ncbi:MAG: glycosyltransferase family 4 protein [Anaerolineae bacterium]|nr:glycosyltransferase family 4 protein [Anaerolineae bacterium]